MAGKAKAEVAEVVESPKQEVVLSHSARQDKVAGVATLSELREIFGDIRPWEEIEPSFLVVKDKSKFEDQPLVIGGFRFNQSSKFMKLIEGTEDKFRPAEFVSMLVAKYDNETGELIPSGVVDEITGEMPVWVIVNDGSTGIQAQLERYAEKYHNDVNQGARMCPPIKAAKGFRSSVYNYENPATHEVSEATTWYIA